MVGALRSGPCEIEAWAAKCGGSCQSKSSDHVAYHTSEGYVFSLLHYSINEYVVRSFLYVLSYSAGTLNIITDIRAHAVLSPCI